MTQRERRTPAERTGHGDTDDKSKVTDGESGYAEKHGPLVDDAGFGEAHSSVDSTSTGDAGARNSEADRAADDEDKTASESNASTQRARHGESKGHAQGRESFDQPPAERRKEEREPHPPRDGGKT